MVTRRLGDVSPAGIWFAGHRPTGAELGKQADALVRAWGLEQTPTVTVLDAFARMPEGSPVAVIGVPSNTTWARARHARPTGPQPLRDQRWPWGFPWLSPADRDIVDQANDELRHIMTVVTEAQRRSPQTFITLLHPEQLGPAQRGTPASIWDLPELRTWARQTGMLRAATYQCRFQPTDFRMPLGLLVSHRLDSKLFNHGWPRIQAQVPHYQGPLPPFCACGRQAHRSRISLKSRVEHQTDTSIIKDSLLKYLVCEVVRETTGLSVAELLRNGPPLALRVRDNLSHTLDASDSQDTWIPSDSQPDPPLHLSSHGEPAPVLHWDRELSRILGIAKPPTPRSSSSSSSSSRSSGTTSPHDQGSHADDIQDQVCVARCRQNKKYEAVRSAKQSERTANGSRERVSSKKGVRKGSGNCCPRPRGQHQNIITMRAWSREAPHPCAGLRRGGLAATGEGR